MTRQGARWNEEQLSEAPAVELLRRLGYSEVSPESLDAERDSLKEAVLRTRLARALQRLNPWLSDDNAQKVVKQIATLQSTGLLPANEQLHTELTYGISVDQDLGAGKQGQQLRFFDFDEPRNNEFLVCRQYRVLGTKKHIKPDIVCFVNGIPLAVIECKSPTKGDQWRAEAITQLRRYQEADSHFKGEGAPRLFETAQLLVAACGENACYGTTLTPARFFFEWREPYPWEKERLGAEFGDVLPHGVRPQEVLLYSMLSPENLLDIVRNFIVFEVENGIKIKKLCRYKQFVAVNRALARIKNPRTSKSASSQSGQQRGGVIWHTQGSGKSLTMLWLAAKLRRDPGLDNPGLVLVTDRTALDKQIIGTFKACGFPNPEHAESVRELRELLKSPTGRTIMTTVQKFQDLPAGDEASADGDAESPSPKSRTGKRSKRAPFEVLSADENIIVMVDEAHRSQYKGLAANMRRALPNAVFFGFTGTPIDKKDKSTLSTFGPYIDTYTIEQAVKDQATVPIFYEGRLPELRILGNSLDELFDREFADRSDEERAAIKKKYANEKAIAEAPRRIESIALDLIKHFEQYIAPNGFKAQLACNTREAAVAYCDAIRRLNGPACEVVISVVHNDKAIFANRGLSNDQIDKLVEEFKGEGGPQILIVCDRLLTGFDAPIEQVLYIDKPLKEHTLLQAIARTNRRYNDAKTYGLIVDYWGVSDHLEEALAIFAPTDIGKPLEPKTDELPRLQSRHEAAMKFFTAVKDRDSLSQCIDALEDEDVRAEFKIAFRRFAQSMDMLLPDERALPYLDDARWLGKIRKGAAARFRDDTVDISDCGAKVRKLIEEAVIADGISLLVSKFPLFSPEFEAKIEALRSSEAKASEMEHAIKDEIHVKLEENPVFYESLREKLEKIIQDYKEQRIDAADKFQLMLELRDEVQDGQADSADDLELSESGYAIYNLLERARPSRAEDSGPGYQAANRDLAELIDDSIDPLTQLVDWQHKDDVQREMRKKVKKLLRATGLENTAITDTATSIVELAKARSKK